eukprot:CAMPEP_0202687498 /NCGR_PEP_ID=MMETSP1385-20130828/3166_1 /ASSEMBLY_ACC=CAM_ASM_000861 /TAXON_ID=933848 /ORGANISM="Elphidium margaritaceum" /LENGTH=591 /DNA_ID=CAMNT_0049342301 /DNA_START=91 /DNA_END=1866 /DNA_ORIENTATION=-
MSWKTNRKSYLVEKPNLSQFVGAEELNGALLIYHQWCNQHLTVRNTSIAVLFTLFGIIGIYAINLPLYVLGLHGNVFFSLATCWSVVCMVAIWTVNVYYHALHFQLLHHHRYSSTGIGIPSPSPSSPPAASRAIWWTLIPLVSYPFCTLVCASFYFSWIGVPFLSSINHQTIHSSSNHVDANTNSVIQYSIFLLSLLYGWIRHELVQCNQIAFHCVQPKRSLFFKQSLKRILFSNTVQTILFGVVCVCVWWCVQCFIVDIGLSVSLSWQLLKILLRVTFNLNYLWLLSDVIMNRILTEKVDLSRYNGCQFPLIENASNELCRNVDCRLLALTQAQSTDNNAAATVSSSSSSVEQSAVQQKYFYYLALIELLDIVQYDAKQRAAIYATQIYYNLVVDTLVAEHTAFVTALYEYVYGDRNPSRMRLKQQQQQQQQQQHHGSSSWTVTQLQSWSLMPQQSIFGALWYKHFTLKPNMTALFEHHEILMYSADILSFLVIHSLEEDELGIVHDSLEQILCVFLESLDILDIFIKSNLYRHMYASDGHTLHRNATINALQKCIESALMRIVVVMHSYLGDLKLPAKNAQRLQSYLVD